MKIIEDSLTVIKAVSDDADLLVDFEYSQPRRALEFYLTSALKASPSFPESRLDVEAAIAQFFAPKPVVFK